jgi:hypothetical protein
MADWSRKETHTRRVIYYLRNPAPHEEVTKAVVAAQQEYEKITGKEARWGDIPMIEGHDEELHIWFEVKEET